MLLLATVSCFSGMAWLALAKSAHWRQVRRGASQSAGAMRGLQVAGSLALLLALWLCLLADAPTMAALVWCMLLAVSAAAVAFTLSWRPHWLRLWLLRRG
ncbi:DUF3325 family protein [Parahaliea aestuarii]|uniref:DUF3325 family protein n=1 Tax=Parahaliea aestuarii TaxID=1852021 RepID=A0A5C8ZQN9_9GAMM|nr:DUF3325 family protein [Parahaliea aestuarii]